MSQIAEWVELLGGAAEKRELVALGATDRSLTDAVRSGEVIRARRGWYCSSSTSETILRAIRVGGRLTGLSAIRELGGWTWSHGPLHVSVAQNSARLRSQWNDKVDLSILAGSGAILHWDGDDVIEGGTKTMVSLHDGLLRTVLDEPFEEAVAALDWALHFGRLDHIEFEHLINCLPKRLQWIKEWVDPRCESFPESLTRTRLRLRGYRVRSQVRLDELRRMDLVVEELVAMEVDGEEHHRDRFLEDRRRDMEISLIGLHVLRPPAALIFSEWHLVLASVEAALARTGFRVGNSGSLREQPRFHY